MILRVSDISDDGLIIEDAGLLGSPFTDPTWRLEGVQLRAERSGTGIGRIYTVNVSCSDKSGNTSTGKTTVSVSHDQGS